MAKQESEETGKVTGARFQPTNILRHGLASFPLVAAILVAASCTGPHGSNNEPVVPSEREETHVLTAVPRVEVDPSEHDFGVIDPGDACEWTFHLRNAGGSSLEITKGKESCKCVLDSIPLRVLEPGQSVPIRMTVRLRGREGEFVDSVAIRTNDPDKPTVDLVLRGTVRRYLAADPDTLAWQNLRRDKPITAEVLVYSQVWDEFTIERVDSSSRAVTHRVRPAPAERLAAAGARAGYLAEVTLAPRDLPPGDARLGEALQWVASPTAKPNEPRSLRLPIQGTFTTTISVSGAGMTPEHTLCMGRVARGEGAHRRLIMKVHDRHRDLSVKQIESHPEYLRIKVSPLSAEVGARGLYRIDVDVPAEAPVANYTQADPAWFRIVTDHPNVPEVRVPVEFAVLGR
ncbi:MAG TPA: hypothetical protein DD670_21355 [Planctomycetaceae bacterium]|nr:hypothetical protein [Planctomycetaceae bacterium]